MFPHKLNRQSQLLVEKIQGAKEFYDSFKGDFPKGFRGSSIIEICAQDRTCEPKSDFSENPYAPKCPIFRKSLPIL